MSNKSREEILVDIAGKYLHSENASKEECSVACQSLYDAIHMKLCDLCMDRGIACDKDTLITTLLGHLVLVARDFAWYNDLEKIIKVISCWSDALYNKYLDVPVECVEEALSIAHAMVVKPSSDFDWLSFMNSYYVKAFVEGYQSMGDITVTDTFVVDMYNAIKCGCKSVLHNNIPLNVDRTPIMSDLEDFPKTLQLTPWYAEIIKFAKHLYEDYMNCTSDVHRRFGATPYVNALASVYMMYLDLQEVQDNA